MVPVFEPYLGEIFLRITYTAIAVGFFVGIIAGHVHGVFRWVSLFLCLWAALAVLHVVSPRAPAFFFQFEHANTIPLPGQLML